MAIPIGLLPLAVVVLFVVHFFWYRILENFLPYPYNTETENKLEKMEQIWGSFYFLPITFYAFLEEFICRYLPLYFAYQIGGKIPGLAIVVISQFLFGTFHGDIKNVAYQSVAGILYLFLYIISGPIGLVTTTIIHAMWNLNCKYKVFEGLLSKLKLS